MVLKLIVPRADTHAAQLAEFRIQCSWCSQVLVVGRPGALTSHSLCPACAIRLLEEDRSPQ